MNSGTQFKRVKFASLRFCTNVRQPYIIIYKSSLIIARSLMFLLVLGAAVAYRPYEGVDPNSLSCDPEGQIYLLLPHYESCDKFYMCDHGEEEEFQCPDETIFDFELQGCDFTWATTCQLREKDAEGSGEGDLDESLEGSGEDLDNGVDGSGQSRWSGPTRPPKEIAAIDLLKLASESHAFRAILDCNDAQAASRQLPYKGDCQRYWRCSGGVPQAAFCSDGLFFNERSQQCDFEANSRCEESQPLELGGEFIEYK